MCAKIKKKNNSGAKRLNLSSKYMRGTLGGGVMGVGERMLINILIFLSFVLYTYVSHVPCLVSYIIYVLSCAFSVIGYQAVDSAR